eukprot:scaffold2874_cov384-Prasinococcus_capsulatus_cf.AAC.7
MLQRKSAQTRTCTTCIAGHVLARLVTAQTPTMPSWVHPDWYWDGVHLYGYWRVSHEFVRNVKPCPLPHQNGGESKSMAA